MSKDTFCTHCGSPIRPRFAGYVKPYKGRRVSIGNRCPNDGERLFTLNFQCVLGKAEMENKSWFKKLITSYDHDGWRYDGMFGLCPICDAKELIDLCEEFEGLRLPPNVFSTAITTLENSWGKEKDKEVEKAIEHIIKVFLGDS